jgi:membrane protein DedA with SNARE-associated domain
MEALVQTFAQYPPEMHYLLLGAMIMLTAMGLFPGSTDLFILSGGVLSGQGSLQLQWTIVTCVLGLVLGETIIFFIGTKAGNKIIQKIKPGLLEKPRFIKISNSVSKKPKSLLLSHRLVPILRPYVLLSASSLGLKREDFLKYHALIILSYVSILAIFSDKIYKLLN